MTVNGRHARYYVAGERGSAERFYLPVTYHRRTGKITRQMTVSAKLLRRVLR